MSNTTRRVREFFGSREACDSDPDLVAVQQQNHRFDFLSLDVNRWIRESLLRLLRQVFHSQVKNPSSSERK